jgi:colanic acid biosynthesis glycosyl transferase WcaI
MRILLLTQLFQPEPNHLKGLAFARELIARGNDVQVLTGFPSYPSGRIYPGYRQRLFTKEKMGGIQIIRVPIYPSHSASGLGRALNYLSFMITAVIPGLFRIQRPDVIHVYQGPATLALPAILLNLILRIPYVLDIQDLWPDSVVSSGMMKIRGGAAILEHWCQLTYRCARRIVVLSPGYKATLIRRGVLAEKIDVVYNWTDEGSRIVPVGGRALENGASRRVPFKVVYSGNLGPVQALGSVIDAAAILDRRHVPVIITFVGDGAESESLRKKARMAGVNNVLFISRQPPMVARALVQDADAALVHLRDDNLGRIGIPQKTQAYLAAGRPIIMAARGESADLVRRAGAGITCEPEDPEGIASAIEALMKLPEHRREKMGLLGREFYGQNLAFKVGIARMLEVFRASIR